MISLNLKNSHPKDIDSEEINKAFEKFQREKENLGFVKLINSFESLKLNLDNVLEISRDFNTFVIIGIGGSDLGTRALHKALSGQYFNEKNSDKKIYFTGDTTDPEAISDLLEVLNLEKTLFLVVSKSGNTIEQGSVFVFFRDLIKNKLGEENVIKHFLFLTDPKSGTLHELAHRDGYGELSIPSDVGGRFSVLSTVGMLPAHLLGYLVPEFLRGARELEESLAADYAATVYSKLKEGKTINILMPYQYNLFEFAKWYQQLFAESLGKDGKGLTPIAALGPTDQHSQLQLYNDGPNDKLFTFIKAENSRSNLNLPEDFTGVEQYEFLKGKSFHEILNYEMETTAFSLSKNERPNIIISIPQINEYNLGQLFYFFEVAVVLLGYMLEINPFDQPGVELSKNAMYGVLRKKGFEQNKKEFEDFLNN